MKRFKNIIKTLIPNFVLNFIIGFFYGWRGNYSNWEEASKKCTGYNAEIILEKVKKSALMVKTGQAIYERDSVIFSRIQYSYPVLSGLLWVAAQNKGQLRVLDFGGSLGSSYYQNKTFLDSLSDVKWNIVEQSNFVKIGQENFTDKRLHFYYSINECIKSNEIDIILISSVLQYIEKPYELLNEIKKTGFKFIIIDRTPFINGIDRITIQKVPGKIYKAKYPCWFFNKKRFINYMSPDYELITEFDALDHSNIKSEFKGFIYRKL